MSDSTKNLSTALGYFRIPSLMISLCSFILFTFKNLKNWREWDIVTGSSQHDVLDSIISFPWPVEWPSGLGDDPSALPLSSDMKLRLRAIRMENNSWQPSWLPIPTSSFILVVLLGLFKQNKKTEIWFVFYLKYTMLTYWPVVLV